MSQEYNGNSGETNVLAIVGFILSFFTALIGLIISAVALHKAKTEYGGNGKGLAIAGIVIGSLEVVAVVLIVVCVFVLSLAIVGSVA